MEVADGPKALLWHLNQLTAVQQAPRFSCAMRPIASGVKSGIIIGIMNLLNMLFLIREEKTAQASFVEIFEKRFALQDAISQLEENQVQLVNTRVCSWCSTTSSKAFVSSTPLVSWKQDARMHSILGLALQNMARSSSTISAMRPLPTGLLSR